MSFTEYTRALVRDDAIIPKDWYDELLEAIIERHDAEYGDLGYLFFSDKDKTDLRAAVMEGSRGPVWEDAGLLSDLFHRLSVKYGVFDADAGIIRNTGATPGGSGYPLYVYLATLHSLTDSEVGDYLEAPQNSHPYWNLIRSGLPELRYFLPNLTRVSTTRKLGYAAVDKEPGQTDEEAIADARTEAYNDWLSYSPASVTDLTTEKVGYVKVLVSALTCEYETKSTQRTVRIPAFMAGKGIKLYAAVRAVAYMGGGFYSTPPLEIACDIDYSLGSAISGTILYNEYDYYDSLNPTSNTWTSVELGTITESGDLTLTVSPQLYVPAVNYVHQAFDFYIKLYTSDVSSHFSYKEALV